LEAWIKEEKIEASYLLSDYMKRSPFRYFQLTKEWEKKGLDYYKVLDLKEAADISEERL